MCLSCVGVILSLSAYWQHNYFCKAENYTKNNASRQTIMHYNAAAGTLFQ